MRNLLMSLFAGLLIPALAWGQEIPKATKEGKEVLQKLVDACIIDGGLKAVEGPKGKQLTVADEDKLKATVAAHAELLTLPLRDALVAGCDQRNEGVRPSYIALLRSYGREKKDELALAFGTFYAAEVAEDQLKYPVALRLYEEAQQHFGSAKEPAWQATSLNSIGEVRYSQGEYAKALDCFERALTVSRKLADGPHPVIATSISRATMSREGSRSSTMASSTWRYSSLRLSGNVPRRT